MAHAKALSFTATALIAAVALTACSSDSNNSSDSASANPALEGITLVQDGKLTVCSNAPFAPFEYEDENGNLTGIDMDLTKLAAEDLGLEFNPVQYDFDAMSSGAAFEAGACDVLATGMTITEERQQKFLFSEPYYDADQGVLVASGTTVNSLEDLKGKKVAVQVETTGKTVAEDAGLSVIDFPEVGSVVQAVLTGQADAAVADKGVLESYVTDELAIAYTQGTNEQYGFGVVKTNQKLADALSKAVAEAKTSGDYDAIITKHVGSAGN